MHFLNYALECCRLSNIALKSCYFITMLKNNVTCKTWMAQW